MRDNIKEQKKESAETMGEITRESLSDFCKREIGNEFTGISYIKIVNEEGTLISPKEDNTLKNCFNEFLMYLFERYSSEYDNKLLDLWEKIPGKKNGKNDGIKKERTGTSDDEISFETKGGEIKRYYGHKPNIDLMRMLRGILINMKNRAEFEND